MQIVEEKKTLPTGTGCRDVPHIPKYEGIDWLNTFVEHRETVMNIDKYLIQVNR